MAEMGKGTGERWCAPHHPMQAVRNHKYLGHPFSTGGGGISSLQQNGKATCTLGSGFWVLLKSRCLSLLLTHTGPLLSVHEDSGLKPNEGSRGIPSAAFPLSS